MLLERGFLRPRARRSRRRSAHRSRSSPIPPVTCVGRDSMSPPSSPTRTPSTAGGSGAGRDSACCAGRLRPPPPWARSDSAAAVLRGRRPRARWARSAAFPQLLRKHDLAAVLGFNFTDVLPPAERLPGRRVERGTRSLRRRTKIPRYARKLIIFFRVGVCHVVANGTASATRAPCGQSP